MAREIKVNIVGDSKGYSKALDSATKSSKGFGTSLTKMAKIAAVGLGAAGVAAGIAGVKMIGLASDAEEVESKFKVVFGKTVPKLTKQIDAFAEATGASRYALKQQVADLGALLKPIIGNTKETGKMSVAVAKLATDLSSFNNVPVEEALLSIRSGLVGEAEPLRKFGVLLNEAAVEAEGLRLGLIKQGDTMTEGEKVQARYSLIMKQTALAQGDAERTSGSFANQLRRLQNKVKDAGTDIGKKLLPMATALVGAFNDAFASVDKFADRLGKAKGFKAKFSVAFTGIKGAAQEVWDEFADLITGTSQAKPLKLKSGKIIEWEAPAAGLAKQIQEGIKSTDWGAIGKTIGANITSKIKVTAEFLNDVLTAGYAWVDSHSDEIGALGLKLVLEMFAKLTDPGFWKDNWQLILGVGLSVFPLGKVGVIGGKIGKALASPLVRLFHGIVNKLPTVLGLAVLGMFKAIGKFIVDSKNRFVAWATGLRGTIKAAFRLTAIVAFYNGMKDIFNKIKGAVTDMANWIRKKVSQIPAFLQPVRAAFFTVLGPIQLIIAAIQRMIDWIGRIPSPGDIVGGIGGAIRGAVPGLASGGDIKRSGLAMVHTGERVIPARAVRNGDSGSSGPGQFALVWAGPDFIRWMREQDRRSRMGGSLA